MLTVSKLQEGRRIYSPEKYMFHMVTLGGNAVVTADEDLHSYLKEFIKDSSFLWGRAVSQRHLSAVYGGKTGQNCGVCL